jgi:hypothetical protein
MLETRGIDSRGELYRENFIEGINGNYHRASRAHRLQTVRN